MKKLTFVLLSLVLALPAVAVTKSDLDKRIRKLTAKFEDMQAKPDKRIPVETMKKAKGVVLMDRTKAGFIFAYQGGGGVALLRQGNSWSAPAFMSATEASLGFQIGGQQSFIVILLMHTNAINSLAEGKVSFGGEASGTAGDQTAKAEGVIDSDDVPVLIYSDVSGLYGGAAIKGGSVSSDTDANLEYYKDYNTVRDIITSTKPPAPSEATKRLQDALTRASKK